MRSLGHALVVGGAGFVGGWLVERRSRVADLGQVMRLAD